jgi:hypothetical protein
MSVIRSKRHISKFEYENTFTKLYHFSADQTTKIGNRRKKWLCAKIDNIMNHSYNLIMDINEGIYQNALTDEDINKLVEQVIYHLISLEKPLMILWNVKRYKSKTMATWCGLLQNEYELLCKLINVRPRYKFKILDYKVINSVDFIKNMAEFHRFVHGKVINAPCKYDDTSGNLLIELVDTAFYYVIAANKKIPSTKEEYEKRTLNINSAISALYKMQRQILFYCNLMQYSESVLNDWRNYLSSELKLLNALKKSDSKRFSKLQ